MAEPLRQGMGSFFRALVQFVDQRGLREQVRSRVSEETRATIDSPPPPLKLIPSTPIDEVEVALQKIAGNEMLAECGIAGFPG